MNSLKIKFANVIDRVEKLNENTIFEMTSFTQCVLGQLDEKPNRELNCIKRVLGCIPLSTCNNSMVSDNGESRWYEFPLCHNAQTRFGSPIWADADWAVIRLFTAEIGFGYITKQEWLTMAKSQFEKMQ